MTRALTSTILVGFLVATSTASAEPTATPRATRSAQQGTKATPAPRPRPDDSKSAAPTPKPALSAPAQLIANVRAGRGDVPRIELAARLAIAGYEAAPEYDVVRENAARELTGRPDGAGDVTADDLRQADAAIARQIGVLRGTTAPPSFEEAARLPGRPQIAGLNIIYLNPLGDPAAANAWKHIIVHQTEGRPGSGRREATDQFANPTKRGVTVWVDTDGTVYWSTAENVIPTHGDGGNRNDNKYIDNSKTYHKVVGTNSIGVEFTGNYPDVAKPPTPQQVQAWLLLVRFLQERYGIAADDVYAHNWIDIKDQRYCEGCDLGTRARKLGYVPSKKPVE